MGAGGMQGPSSSAASTATSGDASQGDYQGVNTNSFTLSGKSQAGGMTMLQTVQLVASLASITFIAWTVSRKK